MPNLNINLGSLDLSCSEKVYVPLMVCSHERSGTHFMMNSISKCTEYTASPFLNYDYLPLGSVVNFFSEQSISSLSHIKQANLSGQRLFNFKVPKGVSNQNIYFSEK